MLVFPEEAWASGEATSHPQLHHQNEVMLVTHKHVHRAPPANDDNIFVAGRQLASEAEEPTVFMIISG